MLTPISCPAACWLRRENFIEAYAWSGPLLTNGAWRSHGHPHVAGEVLNNDYEHAYVRQSGPLEIDLLYNEAKVELTIHRSQ